ncbi:MAG: TVP38/TMEM64 family protein [Pseudomonadota bacterium]
MKKYGKFIVMGVVLLLIALFFIFDLKQYLSLDYIKSQQSEFLSYYKQNPIGTIGIYMAIYIISTALSLPGAAFLTLLAGALFGTLTGTIVVSFASTTGATLAFLVSRFVLRDWVQSKFSQQLKTINDGVEKEGAFYLFTLRLIPLVPFFVINLVMGLTPMKTITFFFVSQVGMLAGTVVYVNAGTQLAQIDSLNGILSPKLLFSFVLLGVFPIVTKKIMSFIKPKTSGQQGA